jgi:peptidoglycan/xylan/chitin deacetylase (PgdA/CDA1 family)
MMPEFYENAVRWHYLFSYLDPFRALRIRRRISRTTDKRTPSKILLLFTADAEYVPPWKSGSWIGVGSDPINLRGLDIIQAALRTYSIHGTFLLEGILAKNDPEVGKMLESQGHEVGYHGYAHESYGGAWTTHTAEQPEILDRKDVRVRIETGKEIIKETIGKTPESFVAPFHHVRKSTMKILAEEAFQVDASLYNHVYGVSEPFQIKCSNYSLIEIPFTVPLRPKWRVGVSPFFPTILEAAQENYQRTVEDIQLPEGSTSQCLCILLTCHPWEFSDENDAKSKTLQKLLRYLVQERRAETITMVEFPHYFRKEFSDSEKYVI